MTGGDLVSGILDSKEFSNRKLSNKNQIKAIYKAMLGRNPTAAESDPAVTMMSNGISVRLFAHQISELDEYKNVCKNFAVPAGTVAITENRDLNYNTTYFVARCYKELMGRKYDVGGLNNWTGRLLNGYETGASLIIAFTRSDEYQKMHLNNEDAVKRMYRTMMNRNGDAAGIKNWKDYMDKGVSIEFVAAGFVSSPEFQLLCRDYGINPGTITLSQSRDRNPALTAFVARCYTEGLNRSFDVGGLNNWTGQLLAKTLTPKQVAYNFVFSLESINRNLSDADFVKMLYRLYMGRNYDTKGLNSWLDHLANGMTRQDVANYFADSPEFQEIVKSYGL